MSALASASASADFVNVCDKELNIEDLHDVYDKVSPLSAHWEEIAMALRLRTDTINSIEAKFGRNALSCLRKVLEHWLKKDYDHERHGIPCWNKVCVAVKKAGDSALADEIAREQEATPHPPPSAAIAGGANPNPLPATGGATLSVTTPAESNISKGGVALSPGCTDRATETFEYEMGLVRKQQYLQDEFKEVIQLTEKSFRSGDLPDIVNYLQIQMVSLGPIKKTANEIREEFEHVSTIPELFAILQDKYVSWFSYTLMKKLVGAFLLKNHLLMRTWKSYEEKLKDYFVNTCSNNSSDQD